MSVARGFAVLARRAPIRAATTFKPRSFATIAPRYKDSTGKPTKWDTVQPDDPEGKLLKFDDIKTEEDLLPPGAEPGTIPTDLEQATGLERLEILGKMQGIDIFDMRPLDASRVGTFKDPIVVKSAGEELQVGCTGCPADSHIVRWCVVSRDRPYERCDECGSVYKMDYIGPADDGHGHDHHHGYTEPKTMADYVKPDYWYR